MTRREATFMTRQRASIWSTSDGAEGHIDQGLRGLRRIALVPIGLAQPVAESDRLAVGCGSSPQQPINAPFSALVIA